jgi:hypothetical protein
MAQPETCGAGGTPWVQVGFSAEDWPDGFRERVVDDFRAGLEARQVQVCTAAGGQSGDPLATIEVGQVPHRKLAVSLHLVDAVTGKRVSRDVDLSGLPSDGRAFAVAVAADELLRASWAELALRSRRTEARAVPPPRQVADVVQDSLPAPSPRPEGEQLGARIAFDGYQGGQLLFGGDVFYRHRLARGLRTEIAFSMREGVSVESDNGTISSRALGGSLGLWLRLVEAAPLELELGSAIRVTRAQLRGEPSNRTQAIGFELTGYPVYARGGLSGTLRLGPLLRLQLCGGAGAPLRSLDAEDDGQSVTGFSGGEIYASAGVALEL